MTFKNILVISDSEKNLTGFMTHSHGLGKLRTRGPAPVRGPPLWEALIYRTQNYIAAVNFKIILKSLIFKIRKFYGLTRERNIRDNAKSRVHDVLDSTLS